MSRHRHKVHLLRRDDFPRRTRKGKTVCGQAVRLECKPTKNGSGHALQEAVHGADYIGQRAHRKLFVVEFRPDFVTCQACLQSATPDLQRADAQPSAEPDTNTTPADPDQRSE